ncbi:MAG: zinc ABC transporter ATP-binding protein ZnuC [Pseudomonadota bacterium]|nr:zinc ABC transporter ATP-binding protein ZnuC [Pseudomonadota bacterium]
MTDDRLLEVSGVTLALQGRTLLHDVGLWVKRRQIVALIGPNGAGKTMLVRVVLGLIHADAGRVWRRPGIRIGYMPQRLVVEDTLPLTVQRFITLGTPAKRRQVQAVLAETGAERVLDTPIQAISGGELQRVMLARALVREPDLLVLDEPAQAVDVTGQYELYELIGQIRNRHGCGILMVSHDLHLVMAATDWVLCLNRHVCCSGHPDSVARDPAYLQMFGHEAVRHLAIYHHHHNHRHDLHGQVVPPDSGHG